MVAMARAASPTLRMRSPSAIGAGIIGAGDSISRIVRARVRVGIAIVGAMLDRTEVLIALAVATIVLPLAFLVALVVGGKRRQRSQPVGQRLVTAVTVLGAGSLGAMVTFAGDLRI